MKTPEEKRWERMQQLLFAEAGGNAQPRISSTRTLFGIKSHVEEVVEKVAAEDTARNLENARKATCENDKAGEGSVESHPNTHRDECLSHNAVN